MTLKYLGNGNNIYFATLGADVVYGQGGSDEIHGRAGADTIYGNVGNDELYGDAGDDSVFGGNGDDEIHGGNGRDLLYGGNGNDRIWSYDPDHDRIWGGAGDDTTIGLNDEIYGGDGDDGLIVSRSDGEDSFTTLNGGADSDRFTMNGSDIDGHRDIAEIVDFSASDRAIEIQGAGLAFVIYSDGTTEMEDDNTFLTWSINTVGDDIVFTFNYTDRDEVIIRGAADWLHIT